jgi:hypothetical protein
MQPPVSARLPGKRLHLQHGPIDLVIAAEGERGAVEAAYAAAEHYFQGVLAGLVAELALLKAPLRGMPPQVEGAIARRMVAACWPYRAVYITPMAAVAGAVAESVLAAMIAEAPLRRATVNNGGDIAIHLAPGEAVTVGVVARPDKPRMAGTFRVASGDRVRGVATSGWRGRSQSLGIADAASVLAATAAQADAAATMVANAVNVEHPAIRRRPACEVKDDSDLGDLPVTVGVGQLPPAAVEEALERGHAEARRLIGLGLIQAAVLLLQGETRVAGTVTPEGSDPLPGRLGETDSAEQGV